MYYMINIILKGFDVVYKYVSLFWTLLMALSDGLYVVSHGGFIGVARISLILQRAFQWELDLI